MESLSDPHVVIELPSRSIRVERLLLTSLGAIAERAGPSTARPCRLESVILSGIIPWVLGGVVLFVDRERELDALRAIYESRRPELVVPYGRRRLEKTFPTAGSRGTCTSIPSRRLRRSSTATRPE